MTEWSYYSRGSQTIQFRENIWDSTSYIGRIMWHGSEISPWKPSACSVNTATVEPHPPSRWTRNCILPDCQNRSLCEFQWTVDRNVGLSFRSEEQYIWVCRIVPYRTGSGSWDYSYIQCDWLGKGLCSEQNSSFPLIPIQSVWGNLTFEWNRCYLFLSTVEFRPYYIKYMWNNISRRINEVTDCGPRSRMHEMMMLWLLLGKYTSLLCLELQGVISSSLASPSFERKYHLCFIDRCHSHSKFVIPNFQKISSIELDGVSPINSYCVY